MSTQNDITYEEFKELCNDAGITTDDESVLEQDYRMGKALADVTDALITSQEEHSKPYTPLEAFGYMETSLTIIKETGGNMEARKHAINLAVMATRFLAECCHDEGKN